MRFIGGVFFDLLEEGMAGRPSVEGVVAVVARYAPVSMGFRTYSGAFFVEGAGCGTACGIFRVLVVQKTSRLRSTEVGNT